MPTHNIKNSGGVARSPLPVGVPQKEWACGGQVSTGHSSPELSAPAPASLPTILSPCPCAAPATPAAQPALPQLPPHWGTLRVGSGESRSVPSLPTSVRGTLTAHARLCFFRLTKHACGDAWESLGKGGQGNMGTWSLGASPATPPPMTLTTERSRCSSNRSRLLK